MDVFDKVINHVAFNASVLIKNFPQDITCSAVWDDYLLIISSKNIFTYFKLPSKLELGLNHISNYTTYQKLHFKGLISRIEIIKELNIMLVLSEKQLYFCDIFNPQNLTLIGSNAFVNCFSHNLLQERTTSFKKSFEITPTLCVGYNRKMKLFRWQSRSFEYINIEMSFAHSILDLLMINELHIIIAFSDSYFLVQITPEELTKCYNVTPILQHTKKRPPLMYAISLNSDMSNWPPFIGNIPDNTYEHLDEKSLNSDNIKSSLYPQLVIFLQDNLLTTIFHSNSYGKQSKLYEFCWTETPLRLEYSFPYIVGFFKGGRIEIRYKDIFIQSINLNDENEELSVIQNSLLSFQSISNSSPLEFTVQLLHRIYQITPVSFESQIESFIDQDLHEVSYQLSRKLDCKTPGALKIKSLAQIEYGLNLFKEKQFELALQILYEANIDLAHIIDLFPRMLLPQFQIEDDYKLIKKKKFRPLTGGDLELGIDCLSKFLSDIRKDLILKEEPNSSILILIDTTLVESYLTINPRLVTSLLKCKKCYCLVEGIEESLKEEGLYKELVLLYRNNELHHKAVELLETFKNDVNFTNFACDLIIQLELESIDPFFIYVDMLLRTNPDMLISILVEYSPKYTEKYRYEICQYISEKSPEHFYIYLDKIVNCWQDENPWYHNKYIAFKALNVQIHLRKYYMNENTPYVFPGSELELFSSSHSELIDLLLCNQFYEPENICDYFNWKYFYVERSIVFYRLHLLNKSINIYLSDLKDVDMAEKFCQILFIRKSNLGLNSNECGEGYFVLITMCLSVYIDNTLPFENYGAELFFKHTQKMSMTQITTILSKFPQKYSIKQLEPVISKFLAINSHQHNLLNIYRSIGDRALFIKKCMKLLTESTSVVIEESSTCIKCMKSIGLSSFSRSINGKLFHKNCLNESL